MHIINLTIECKTAIGDDTKIVCMNSDYVVRIDANDCGTFVSSPVKKLIVRYGKEYKESNITEVTDGGKTYLQAVLPLIERQDYVDLGVCGKQTDDPTETPLYTSKSARFTCDKSILCGAVVPKYEPKMSTLTATKNGNYKAVDHNADGFYEVDVQVPLKIEESRTVDLNMLDGNQVIVPSYATYSMTEVTIVKPLNLVPENIREGVDIGGVVGSFEVPDYDGTVEIVEVPDIEL